MSTLEQMTEQCDCCGDTLEIGQIGKCDDCQQTEADEDGPDDTGSNP